MITCANDIPISDSENLMTAEGGCPHCHRPLRGTEWIHAECLQERLNDSADDMYGLLKKLLLAAWDNERRAGMREAQALVDEIERTR